jgi:sugar phosphate isomerase/epimerase
MKRWHAVSHECKTGKQRAFMTRAAATRYLVQHGVFPALVLVSLAAAFCTTSAGCTAGRARRPEPTNLLACRLENYGKFQDAAWAHLRSIGIKHVFLGVPPPEQVRSVKRRLAEHGLTAVVLRGHTDLSRPSCIDELATQLQTCEKMGVKYMFLSPKHPGVSKQVACERLRRAGHIAAKHGVTIALETHPDLGTNGDVHLQTIKHINHPNVRVNFDVANITYYNRNTDALTELKKIIDYVATVELKDHNGRYETWNFPALGQGIVDIPGVLRLLKEHGYAGPMSIEIEGVRGIERDEAGIKKDIADSVAYVRSLGRFR